MDCIVEQTFSGILEHKQAVEEIVERLKRKRINFFISFQVRLFLTPSAIILKRNKTASSANCKSPSLWKIEMDFYELVYFLELDRVAFTWICVNYIKF